MAQKAVQIIADERNSAALRGFLSTGELGTTEMDLDEACQHLNIKFDPKMDEDTLNVTLSFALDDSRGKRTEQAVAAVRRAYQERNQLTYHAPDSWPVGLESHGNTCYLNSLLQYYFTIKPLRDLVLDIEQHNFDLGTHETKSQRVQSIHLKRYEIEAYQKFATHLKILFERMITSQKSTVKPDTELVCGAFLTPNEAKAVEKIGKENATADGLDMDIDVTASNEMNGQQSQDRPKDMNQAASKTLARSNSNASSITLIDEGEAVSSSEAVPPPEISMLTPPDSPKVGCTEPPNKPPLPPRPVIEGERPKTQLELAEEAAKRQQDVAEVIEDLLRRLRAAIEPRGEDAHGEQLDQLRE